MGFICDLTNGKSNPSLRIMGQIADVLGHIFAGALKKYILRQSLGLKNGRN